MSLFAPALSSTWKQIEDAGLDPEPLFLHHGIQKSEIFDPNARVSAAQVDRVIAEAMAEIRDPFFGLREADYFRPAHLGSLGFAWLASTNLLEAFRRLNRYAKVINDKLEIALEEGAPTIRISVREHRPSADPYQRDAGCLAVLVRMCRFLCGDGWNPVHVSVAHPEPPDASYFYAYFRCPVMFGAEANALEIDSQQAVERIAGANEYLAQLNDHIVVRYIAHRSREDIVSRVRAAVLDSLGDGQTTEKAVAAQLNMSARQLNRRLKEKNTSFRNLLVECRRELAEQYLSDSSLSLTEISYLLGFSESSSFSRAYRRWTGRSPTQARGA
jgi:AraC-like DNA-binding protein